MSIAISSRRERAVAGGLSALVAALVALGLVLGLRVDLVRRTTDALATFTVGPVAPPPPPVRPTPHRPSPRRSGRAAPPNLKSRATELVAPVPVIPAPPPPVVVAPIAFAGNQASQGAVLRPGPGTGAGGMGNGTGSGGEGNGDCGGGDGDGTAPVHLKGRLKDSDRPADATGEGLSGTVSVLYRVGLDGRVSDCRITHSSGHPELDAITCRLIEQRFRYRPSLDRGGRPVASWVEADHEWLDRHQSESDAGD